MPHEWHMQAAADVAKTPELPPFEDFFKKIPALARPLRIASPCVGLHSCAVALDAMGVDARHGNVYDLEAGYSSWLTSLMQKAGHEVVRLNLGRQDGRELNLGPRQGSA